MKPRARSSSQASLNDEQPRRSPRRYPPPGPATSKDSQSAVFRAAVANGPWLSFVLCCSHWSVTLLFRVHLFVALALAPVSTSADEKFLQDMKPKHGKHPKTLFTKNPASCRIGLLTHYPVPSSADAEESDSYAITMAWSAQLKPFRCDSYMYAVAAGKLRNTKVMFDVCFLVSMRTLFDDFFVSSRLSKTFVKPLCCKS